MKKNIFFKTQLIKNTIILIVCSLLIRALSLLNRIMLTRILGNDGISLYVICLPSIMLFFSIGSFSLSTSITKIVSENEVTKKYSNKTILKKSFYIGVLTSLITILILIIIINPLTMKWLKQSETFYPILASSILIPLVTFNNIIRGYYNGINKINITAFANLFEQISRIVITIILLMIFIERSIIFLVTITIISMGFGDLISLLYYLLLLRKKELDSSSKENPTSSIFSIALPTTLSRLSGNLTYFLEPIIYTSALIMIGLTEKEIILKYSSITAYAIPLITMFSFISTSISIAIIPRISSAYTAKNMKETNYLIKKSILYSFLPGLIITILLTFYSKEYMNLIYKTDIGSDYVKKLSALFILFYIQAPIYASLQAIGKSKQIFIISIITNIVKLLLIFLLTFVDFIKYDSLILAMVIYTTLSTLIYYFYLKNVVKFEFNKLIVLKLMILVIISVLLISILKFYINNYFIVSFISVLSYYIFYRLINFANLDNN